MYGPLRGQSIVQPLSSQQLSAVRPYNARTLSSFDEQISQALNKALTSLQAHLEADLTALTQELMTAADASRRAAASEASRMAVDDMRRHAEAQMAQLKDEASAEVAALRASLQGQLDDVKRKAEVQVADARRASQAQVDEAKRTTQAEVGTYRKKIVALEADLDLTKHQAQVDHERAEAELNALKQNTQFLAEDAVIAQLSAAEADADRRVSVEVDRTRTDAHQSDLAAAARLLDAIRAIDGAHTLGDVLTTLAQCAGREVERAAVFIVKGNTLRGWRLSGFTDDATQQPGSLVLDIDAAGVAGAVVSQGTTGALAPSVAADGDALPQFARGAGWRHAVGMPIAVGGDVVAVLYADALRSDVPSAACRWPAVLEVLARHASRSLEALTIEQAAGINPRLRSVPVLRRSLPGPVEYGGSGEEDAARRYARLLVSEIRMYHEPDVEAGRRGRDLRRRLGTEIDRARRQYEERTPAAVRQTTDFFEQELVRTLADGDRSLLG